jgi:hypothetical protein
MLSFLQVKICDIRNVKKISEVNYSLPGCSAALALTFLDESSITFGMKTGEEPHIHCSGVGEGETHWRRNDKGRPFYAVQSNPAVETVEMILSRQPEATSSCTLESEIYPTIESEICLTLESEFCLTLEIEVCLLCRATR